MTRLNSAFHSSPEEHAGRTQWLLASILLTFVLLAGCVERGSSVSSVANLPSVGETINIAGPTLDGGTIDLKDYRGKVVLIDFWASWCGPCIAELPNVRAVYDQYHDQGFEVLAVNLDDERTELDDFMALHNEPWPQIFFDEDGKRGWDNPIVAQYGIQGIPCLVVVDREGKVAALDVRGSDIETAVVKALQ